MNNQNKILNLYCLTSELLPEDSRKQLAIGNTFLTATYLTAKIMEEIWKDIDGFEGIYQVSNLGRIKRIAHFSECSNKKLFLCERINRKGLDRYGYEKIVLTKCQAKTTKQVHRLVAEAFISNPNNLETVNHKNGIKTDNRVDNLEYLTQKENVRHSIDILHKEYRLIGKSVNQYDLNGNFIRNFRSINQINRILGYNISAISLCCNNKLKTAYNFKWRFA